MKLVQQHLAVIWPIKNPMSLQFHRKHDKKLQLGKS
jgi:hypothetical protein